MTTPPVLTGSFGETPRLLGRHRLTDVRIDGTTGGAPWTEFMHYLDLPVRLPAHDGGDAGRFDLALPARLAFLRDVADEAVADARRTTTHLDDPYVYVTARRGFAAPGSPLNRPGWHADDWGGSDLNYVWSDRYPTRLLLSDESLDVPDDPVGSMRAMAAYAELAATGTGPAGLRVVDSPVETLVRLTPYVVHDTPLVPAPGGMRSFLKVTVSSRRYDLVGNSHNHRLHYRWPMVGRTVARNQATCRTTTLQEA